jgi:hypothetical protein
VQLHDCFILIGTQDFTGDLDLGTAQYGPGKQVRHRMPGRPSGKSGGCRK